MAVNWRVTTWNLQGSASPPIDRIGAVVRDLGTDVLVLQEVRRAQCRRLAAALGWQRTWHRKHHPYSPFLWWRTEGMAILSPHRIVHAWSISLTPHVSTWTYRHRIAVVATVQRPDGASLGVVDLHLASDASGGEERIEQAVRVRGLLDDIASPSVAAGDLNDHDESAVVDTLRGTSHLDAWVVADERSAGEGFTNPSHAPHQRLDHVLVPATSSAVTAHVPTGDSVWAELSDHLPLTAHFVVGERENGQMRSQ